MKKIEIITDNQMYENAIRRYVKFVLNDQEMKNLILVDVNTVLDPSQNRTDRIGITLAKKYVVDPNNLVILLSMEKESYLMKNNEHFAALMAYPNVDFCDILDMQNLYAKYLTLSQGKKKKDQTAIELYEFSQHERTIAILRHGIDGRLTSSEGKIKFLAEARQAGLNGSDEEIIQFIRNWKPGTSGQFKGKYLDGIFVDALDTLFNHNWELVSSVKNAVQKMAEDNNKKIYIISDSDKYQLEQKLKGYGIEWTLLSKYDLRGVTLEIVIDNLTLSEFENAYEIKAKEFINVLDL